jgi:succinoglycan biosynthesis protein ExoO
MSLSVIVAAYNAQETIERALRSALDQTRPVAEIIVVDDVSTDQTRSIVRSMAASDPRIILIESPANQGPSAARNLGLRAAKGDWIGVLDADDAWSLDRVQVIMDAIARFEVDVVTDNQLLYDAGVGEVTRVGFPPARGTRWIKPIDVFEQDIQMGAEFSFGILKPVIRRTFLESHGLSYDGSIRYGEDLLFLADMLLSRARVLLIPEPLYIYTTLVGGRSGKASPHSKSVPRFDLFAEAVEARRLKYREVITADIDRAMKRLSRRFRLVHESNLARAERRTRGLFAYALYVGRRPSVLAEVLRSRATYLKRRLARAKLEVRPASPQRSRA